jgi:hypothetical protein
MKNIFVKKKLKKHCGFKACKFNLIEIEGKE